MFAILVGLNARHPLASTATPLVFALGAGALGFVTNGSGLLIFGSTEFVFGGFFSILSALLLGPWWGGLTALIAFSRTVETWGHSTGLFCFTVEAVMLGWLVTRQKWNPLLALAAAWAVIGLLISTSYFIFGNKTPIPCNVGTVLAYGANGFFMTLAALLVRTDVRTATTQLSDSSRALADTTAQRDELARQLEDLRHTLEDSVEARTEQLRQAVAAAESAGQAKSDFLAGMSHELRTPLNVIMGNAALLQEQDLGAGTTAQHQSLRDIELSGQHLLTLITDVLDLSRIEAGLLELTIQPTPIAETCESALRFMRDTAARKQILVTFESHHQTKVSPLDGRRLKQILINLLANAIKSTPGGGPTPALAGDRARTA